MLMFQLCMLPFAPQGVSLDIFSIEDAIEDQLSHVSSQCRDTLFDCLSTCIHTYPLRQSGRL